MSICVSALTATLLAAGPAPVHVAGRIIAVDVKARTFNVAESETRTVAVFVDEHSVIVLDGDDDATIDDLFVGDEVQSATLLRQPDGRLLLEKAVVRSGTDDEGEGDRQTRADGPRQS